MKKSAYYFSHDYNSRNDDKILELRNKFKNEGYAVYFYCLETMAERGDGYIIASLMGGLSLGYMVVYEWLLEFLEFCVETGLFMKDAKGYYSPRMVEHLNMRNLLKIKGKEGAKKRWANSPPNSPPNAKERKGKERKEKKDIEKDPRIKDFIDYAFSTVKNKTGQKMLVSGGKDGKTIQTMLSFYKAEKLKQLWDKFLVSEDKFIQGAGFSIGVFQSQINKLLHQKEDWRST